MTPNVNYFEQIEDYCQELLSDDAKLQFETRLKQDAELRFEVKLRTEIQTAIHEKDIISLRSKLKNIDSQNKNSNSQDKSFDLLNNLTDIQELSDELTPEELINFYDSMPKVHVHQHEIAETENIHQFYKEQNRTKTDSEIDNSDDLDFEEFDGIEEAILEKDIINLRHALAQVAKSMEPQFGIEEIDDYMNARLAEKEMAEFEEELSNNSELKKEVELHKEIEMAVKETDILVLRNQLSQIMKSETSWNVSEQSIEDFIDGELDEALLEEFNAELEENSDLMAEVELRRQVNEIPGEQDIQKLRAALSEAKEEAESNKVRKMIPDVPVRLQNFVRASVAVVIVLIAVAGVFNSGYLSMQNTYDKFFELPAWSAERSVSANVTLLQQAQSAFAKGDYKGVVNLLGNGTEAAGNNPVFSFYAGASLQKMNKLKEAIADYTKVINHGDNLFVEEAEWYRSLCYLKLGKKLEAKQELLAVINRKGYFEHDAKAVLRRLKLAPE
jgi:anti-sigma factor RsiW